MNKPNSSFTTVEALKRELKRWEHEFISIHKRSPTKDDIRNNPTIKHKYKEYSSIKRKLSLSSKASNQNKTPKTPTHKSESNGRASPGREAATYSVNTAVPIELGPTPQIFGKSMSIFEISLSPVKKRLELPTPDVSSEMETTIQAVSSPPPEIVISSAHESYEDSSFEDPNTISSSDFLAVSKAVDKLLPRRRTYGPNSPLRIPTSVKIKTPIKLDMGPSEPIEETTNFDTPPIWRGSLSKPLRDLEEEFITVSMNFNPFEDDENVTLNHLSEHEDGIDTKDEILENEGSVNAHRSRRRKNRVRVRRPSDVDIPPALQVERVNLHSQLRSLKKAQLQDFTGETDEAPSVKEDTAVAGALIEDHEKAPSVESKKSHGRRPKKYNLVSNNFRRLKLPRRTANGKTKYFRGRRR